MGEWTLFSNHGHVLVCLARNNQARLRDVAAAVGITERAVQNILRELQDSGMVAVSKHGRCNHYQINLRQSLRHPLEAHCTVGKLMQLLNAADEQGPAASKPEKTAPTVSKSPKTPGAKAQAAKNPTATTQVERDTESRTEPKAESRTEPKAQSGTEPKADPPRKSRSKPESEVPPSTQQGSLF